MGVLVLLVLLTAFIAIGTGRLKKKKDAMLTLVTLSLRVDVN